MFSTWPGLATRCGLMLKASAILAGRYDRFDIEIMDSNGKLYLSNCTSLLLQTQTDLEIVRNSIRLGVPEIELQARIRNNSSFDLNQVDLEFF